MAEEVIWDPWSKESNDTMTTWLRAAKLAGVLSDDFYMGEVFNIVDNAERFDLLGDMSREQAVLLCGLWMGRYRGNIETHKWIPKDYLDKTDLEALEESCQALLDANTDNEFWNALSRLHVAMGSVHPENAT